MLLSDRHTVTRFFYDSSVYQFNVDDECLNDDADDVDVNACAVVYNSDREFGGIETDPHEFNKPKLSRPTQYQNRSRRYQTFDEISTIRIIGFTSLLVSVLL